MSVETQFSPQDFYQILSHYELGRYIGSEAVSQGTVQTNYFLHPTLGMYVFRYYENRSKESVLFESDLLLYLKEHQYPCPTPFLNERGSSVGIYQGKPYVIFECIEAWIQVSKRWLDNKISDWGIFGAAGVWDSLVLFTNGYLWAHHPYSMYNRAASRRHHHV